MSLPTLDKDSLYSTANLDLQLDVVVLLHEMNLIQSKPGRSKLYECS